MKFVNLTPHPITVVTPGGEVHSLVSQGEARLGVQRQLVRAVEFMGEELSVYSYRYSASPTLPPASPEAYLLVSRLVAQAYPDRRDLLVPAELRRDEGGNVIACAAFSVVAESTRRVLLSRLIDFFDAAFDLSSSGADSTFGRHLPAAYEAIGVDWRRLVEPDFSRLFNGLMIRGADSVGHVWCAAFPSPEVLQHCLENASTGDLLFLHHPMDIRSGVPDATWGEGFRPVPRQVLERLRTAGISVYVCHASLDRSWPVGTTAAIVTALGGRRREAIFDRRGPACGWVCDISPRTREELVLELQDLFRVANIATAGPVHNVIERAAIIAGSADSVNDMERAEAAGAQAYIAGDFQPRVASPEGRQRFAAVQEFLSTSRMSFFAVSHAASEHLVMETQIVPLLESQLGVRASAIAEPAWWR